MRMNKYVRCIELPSVMLALHYDPWSAHLHIGQHDTLVNVPNSVNCTLLRNQDEEFSWDNCLALQIVAMRCLPRGCRRFE